MGYIDVGRAKVGNEVRIDVRGRTVDAEVVKLPFYRSAG
jgi:aminomethyltransferase